MTEQTKVTGTIVCDIDLNKDGEVIPAYTPFELKDGEILFTNEVYNVKKRIWEADL